MTERRTWSEAEEAWFEKYLALAPQEVSPEKWRRTCHLLDVIATPERSQKDSSRTPPSSPAA
jgi:hypothetical protein